MEAADQPLRRLAQKNARARCAAPCGRLKPVRAACVCACRSRSPQHLRALVRVGAAYQAVSLAPGRRAAPM